MPMPHPSHLCRLSLALATAALALLSACSRNGDTPPAPQAAPLSQAAVPASQASISEGVPSPEGAGLQSRSSHRYLYAVYCNGLVDRIDLEQRKKVASFQLAERSGTPPAVAAAPSPGVRPDSCLAHPVSPQSASDLAQGRVHVVATDQFYRSGDEPKKPYRLLTFSLPDWHLEKSSDLGLFDVLNGTPPRVANDGKGGWAAVPPGKGSDLPVADLASYQGMDNVASPQVTEWSASTALVEFADTKGKQLPQAGMADTATRRFTRLGAPPNDVSAEVRLAPGGRFALRQIERMDAGQVVGTGELRLYGADGKIAATFNDKSIAGVWHTVALTPQGLAVYTDGAGNYRFVSLEREFGLEPVANDWTDDLDGTRPGVVYGAR